MQLYATSANEFIRDSIKKGIAKKLEDAWFEYYRRPAGASELISWANSLPQLASFLQYAKLGDVGVIVEMHLPLADRRIDCIITGKDSSGRDHAVLIELKQWSSAKNTDSDVSVQTFVGKAERDQLHPSIQAQGYLNWLNDMNSAFYDTDRVTLDACSWLHNMTDDDASALKAEKFSQILKQGPLFTASDAQEIAKYLSKRVGYGSGLDVLEKITSGKDGPSKGLLKHTAAVIKGEPVYTLLDEQIVAYDAILKILRHNLKKSRRVVIIVKGGPGTGKSVLAINSLAAMLKMGLNAQYVTGSRAFTQTFWRILGTRSKPLFRYTNNYMQAEAGSVDALIVDEAHRIRSSSTNRFTPKTTRSDRAQIDELIQAARVTVFLIDDHQAVRPGEVGSVQYLLEAAIRNEADVFQYDLRTQFRCAGSQQYIDWTDHLLGIRDTGVVKLGNADGFDFRIFDSADALDAAIRDRASHGDSARVTAGFCWPWSKPMQDGSLPNDVRIGNYERPWNAQPEATHLAKGIPKAQFWATEVGGIEQVGCIYTAQGFEFDYCGVIIGEDLVARGSIWVGQPSASYDSQVKRSSVGIFTECVRNTYRVLLTRGMKGCYLYCVDAETREFLKSRL